MKILFINYELPPIGGGGGRATWQIAKRLAARDHDITILTSCFRGQPEDETRGGVSIRRIHVGRSHADRCPPLELFKFMFRSRGAVVRLADEIQPDVACAFFAIPGGPPALRLLRARGIPYVLALRGSDVPRPELAKHQRLHLFTKPFIRRYLRNAAGVTAVSDGLKSAALALTPEVNVAVIPNGVDTNLFTPDDDACASTGQPKDILFVGRLREFKQVQDVLDALPVAEKTLGRPLRFTIVGDGPHREELQAHAKRLSQGGMTSEVLFLGWVEQEALREIYAAASLVVLPSLVEGHPNVLLEGMACGAPCVASDVPGTREVVTEGAGLLVPPRCPQSIAEAVTDVLADREHWLAMRQAALSRAAEFSWDRVADDYEALLEQASGRAGGAT
jgi:glycogen synthase